MRKIYTLIVFSLFILNQIHAQTGSLQGKVYDESNKQGVPFANVVLEQNGAQKGYGETDDNGNYAIKPIVPGTYDVKVSYLGFQPKVYTGIIVTSDRISFQDVALKSSVSTLPDIVISTQKLVEPDKTTTGSTITKDEIKNISTRGVNNYAALSAGVFQKDNGAGFNINGSRDYSNKYYVDGIPMRGGLSLPASSIEQLTVLTGGIPSRYGDATGGVINITTRGPSQQYSGGLELETSELLDGAGYNLASFNLSGPAFTKNRKTDSASTKVGFFVSGEYEHTAGGLSAVQLYKVKDDVLKNLHENPLAPSPSSVGFVPASSFLKADDLEEIDRYQNDANNDYRFTGKLDFQLNKYLNLIVGADGVLSRFYNNTFARNLLNSQEGNNYEKDNTYRGFVRFTQRFPTASGESNKSATIFQNAFYSIQTDYTKFYSTNGDKNLGRNAFDYGYVGKFNTYNQPIYGFGKDSITGLTGWLLLGYQDTLTTFEPGSLNPYLANYTKEYYQLIGNDPAGFYQNIFDILNGGGIINGIIPFSNTSAYSIFAGSGYPIFSYGILNRDQLRLSLNASVDIVNATKGEKGRHALEFGFEYEQRIDRGYTVLPVGLWQQARQLTNNQIASLDKTNPIPVYDNSGVFLDTVRYNRGYVEGDQSYFDKALRQSLGLPVNGTDFIYIDELDPSQLSLSMFSPDELLNSGSSFVDYYGYDYLGNVLKKQPTLDDFFNQKDANGNFTRNSAAFRPVYAAAYIQDKFNFKDLIFNIGLRVDRFDANQKVLKDPYSLYPIRTAGEVSQFGDHPSNIGDDFYVYVNDLPDPTKIVGYRHNGTWYSAQGAVVNNPNDIALLTATKTITPYLVNTNTESLNLGPEGFTDYNPQFTIMPRIAFSFPISDQALFFAHYDVLSQRPLVGLRATPVQYYFLKGTNNSFINNPNLKPERTIDFQVGFKQALGSSSALTLSATYRELKDNIQAVKILYAYPVNYTTYGNYDFGTVQSFQLTYELRRIKNVKLDANYTLQFANGTGSDATSSLNLINSGEPNIRTILPFSYDQRHNINLLVDYRYGEGKNYNGPLFGQSDKQLLANTGLNLILIAGSGTPYTRQSTSTPTQINGVATQSSTEGNPNGSRLPWTFRMNARVDKDFKIKGEQPDKGLYLNVYLLVENLLNANNVISVYGYTGNPNDDGYLASAGGQDYAARQLDPQSFSLLYNIAVNNPGNYSLPRTIRLGAVLNF
ncbi:MAG: carboxypeptidase regulatory-like domain-containing protein [Chitinophagales bacterium]|nr:carboxypeptidase regulatory-like domain-containing protein [Chitinophagales bacterium]